MVRGDSEGACFHSGDVAPHRPPATPGDAGGAGLPLPLPPPPARPRPGAGVGPADGGEVPRLHAAHRRRHPFIGRVKPPPHPLGGGV